MNGNLLALGGAAVLAAGAALARRGSAVKLEGENLAPLQKRLLHVLRSYPNPDVSIRALELVVKLPGVMLDDHSRLHEGYLGPAGVRQARRDLEKRGSVPKLEGLKNLSTSRNLVRAWDEYVRSGLWYDGTQLAARSEWDSLIGWIGKEVNRIVRDKPALSSIPLNHLIDTANRTHVKNLTLDKVQRLLRYFDGYYADLRGPQSKWGMTMADTAALAADSMSNRIVIVKHETKRWSELDMSAIFGHDPRAEDHYDAHTKDRWPLTIARGDFYGAFKSAIIQGDGGYYGFPLDNAAASDILIAEHLRRLREALPEIRDWVGSGQAGDINRLTYEQAKTRSTAWHRAIARAVVATHGPKNERALPATGGTVIATLRSGGTIRELGLPDLKAESDAMGHCVGRVDTYRLKIQNGTGRILSIRDKAGQPVFTVELRRIPYVRTPEGELWKQPGWSIVQVKGAEDRIPGLTKARTKSMPGVSSLYHEDDIIADVRAWIDRARVKFVSTPDVDRAVEAFAELKRMGISMDRGVVRDLDVVRALGRMP